jgi:hypothetical protein
MSEPGQAPVPTTVTQAMAMAEAGLAWLAMADVASVPAAEQAECLRALERIESRHTTARARVLGVFNAQAGYEDDGHGSARSWLRWQTRVTGSAAGGALGWSRRLSAHPDVAGALAGGEVSPSWARQLCDWTELLPEASALRRTRSCWARHCQEQTCQIWAGLPRRCAGMTGSPTAGSGWRQPSAVRGSWTVI